MQPFKGNGKEVSGELKRKGSVRTCVPEKAIMKFMRRASLLFCKLVGGEVKKGHKKGNKKIEIRYFSSLYTCSLSAENYCEGIASTQTCK